MCILYCSMEQNARAESSAECQLARRPNVQAGGRAVGQKPPSTVCGCTGLRPGLRHTDELQLERNSALCCLNT